MTALKMRLTLVMRVALWVTQREKEGIETTQEKLRAYWENVPGVTKEDVTGVLMSSTFHQLVEYL